jgi:ABC-type branched-subunit amino acid transport system ATPase component/branched-subunit amino acid ABC-type transport system permease component
VNDFLPFIVIGIAVGSIYGLAATGLVLTYKTSGIFNFAFGALAAVSVLVFYKLHVESGWPWPVAAAVCVLVLGPLMGLALELLARRLMTVDHTLQIASTIGIVLFVVAAATIWFSDVSGSFPSFLPTTTIRIFDVNVEWEQIIVVLVALVATIALYCFLHFTRRGAQMRAVVDDPDLLAVAGESPVRVRRWAWIIGSSFAAMAGLLIAPSLPIDAMVLTLLVVQAFGAAAIGYFSNLPLTYIGGLLIGIAGALATKYVVNVSWLAGLPAGLPFIALFVVLLITPRRRLAPRRFLTPRTIPPSWHPPLRIRLGSAVVVVGFLCLVPSMVGTQLTSYTSALLLAMLVLSLGLLIRTSRQVSLCHYAFAAIGAASMAHFTTGFGIPWFGALLLAALVAVPVGALIAIPAIRLSGVFLALATLGFGIMLENLVYTQGFMFGPNANGLSVPRPDLNLGFINLGSDRGMYFLVLTVLVVVAIGSVVLAESRLGRLLRALGDSPLALETCGLNVNVTKVLIFSVSAFVAALSGALTASLFTFAIGSNFPSFSSLTLVVLVTVIVVGEPWYALIAGAAIVLVPLWLPSGNISNYLVAFFGLAAILLPAFRDKIQLVPNTVRRMVDKLGGHAHRAVPLPISTAPIPTGVSVRDGRSLMREARAPAKPLTTTDEGLVVEHLTVRFGGVLAVDDVGLRARPATITGLVGPNGAGKTTVFNACSGLVRPTEGHITLHGDDITQASRSQRARLGLGRSFQRVQLFESLDVRTNVALAPQCALAGRNPYRQVFSSTGDARAIDQATSDAIALAGIGAFVEAPVKELSTGQRRLVELARVLAGNFDLLLLDEPSSGLDHGETEQFGLILRGVVAERGLGILLVEHDLALVQQTCERVYVLDFGQMLFDGTAEEMLASDIVQAAYLGTESTERSHQGAR